MKYVALGRTGITVSRLCFGTLTMGPLQRNLPLSQGVQLLECAFEHGVNFLDTAEIYGTYPYVKEALRIAPQTVVCTKSYSYDAKTAEKSLKLAMDGIGREYIDLFLLHEQESVHTIRGHYEAIEYFLKKKEEGLIGAFGLSTHFVAAVEASLRYPEIEVIHPLINMTGVGIADGTRDMMLAAIQKAKAQGKGIFAMKPLGGGHLIAKREEAMQFMLNQACIDSIAMGMQTIPEVHYNCAVFSGETPDSELAVEIGLQSRRLMIHDWCEGCGACVKTCKNHALTLDGGRARVDAEACVLCGYCARVCPQFCIKVI